MDDKEFQKLWLLNREHLLANDAEWKEMRESYKTRSGADMLLYAIPVVTGIVCIDYLPFCSELLKWVVSAFIMIAVTVVCLWVKGLVSGVKSASEIERRVKEEYRRQLEHGNS